MAWLNIDKFLGVNLRMLSAEMPAYFFEKMINYKPSEKIRSLVKRKPYDHLSSDLNTVDKMVELKDSNNDRSLIFTHASGALSVKPWSGGSYGASDVIVDTAMPAGHSIDTFSPLISRNILYGGAGLGANDIPFSIRYVDAETFYCSSSSITTTAGLKQVPMAASLSDLGFSLEGEIGRSNFTTADTLALGLYYFKAMPVYSDGTIGSGSVNPFAIVSHLDSGIANKYIKITISTSGYNPSNSPTLIGIDLAVAFKPEDTIDYNPTYYIFDRINLNEEFQDTYGEHTGTFEDHATYLNVFKIDNEESQPLTFNPVGLKLKDSTSAAFFDIEITGVESTSPNHYLKLASLPSGYSPSTTYTANIVSETDTDTVSFYDEFYRICGTEMYEHLNVPAGDSEITDHRYDLSVIAGKRLFTFSTESIYGYYTPTDRYNLFTYLNELILQDMPTAVMEINDDVLIFSRIRGERYRVIDNGEVIKDDDFLSFGCLSTDSWVKTNSDEIYLMSRSGAWKITSRGSVKISGEIESDVLNGLDSLTDTELETCVVRFNQIQRQILFIFTVDGSNLIWVYDIEASEIGGLNTWYQISTDKTITTGIINDDAHFLTGGGNDLLNWDHHRSVVAQDLEELKAELKIKLLTSGFVNKKVRFKRLLLKTSDISKVNLDIDYNDAALSPTSITPDANGELYLRAIARNMALEIDTDTDSLTFNIDKIQIETQELSR